MTWVRSWIIWFGMSPLMIVSFLRGWDFFLCQWLKLKSCEKTIVRIRQKPNDKMEIHGRTWFIMPFEIMMNFLDETIKPFFYALETVDLQTIIIRCIKPHYARWKKYNFFLFFFIDIWSFWPSPSAEFSQQRIIHSSSNKPN